MDSVSDKKFTEQAEQCRRQALCYLGRPEAPFLLQVARAFDDLAQRDSTSRERLAD